MDAYALSGYKQCVGFLYRAKFRELGDGLDKEAIGTCFFVTAKPSFQSRRSGYLVTAGHVLNDLLQTDGGMFVRVNKSSLTGVQYVPLPTAGWRRHPNAEVDLVVLPWWPPALDMTITALPLHIIAGARNFAAPWQKNWPPEEGEETVLIGLMAQHQGIERNYPIVRMGHIALNTDELIALECGTSQYRIIESQAYKGNSGAPVWVRYTGEQRDLQADLRIDKREWKYEETFAFLGVLVSGFGSEAEIKRRGVNTETYWNYGISAVVPGEILVEHLRNLEAEHDRAEEDRR